MNKAEWDAMEARRKDGLVLTTLWKAENGKPIDIHWNDDPEMDACYPEYIPSGKPWKTHGECDAVPVPRFTTDRNACALVVDQIEKHGHNTQMLFHIALGNELCWARRTPDIMEWEKLWEWLRANPDTICYCAVKVVRDE